MPDFVGTGGVTDVFLVVEVILEDVEVVLLVVVIGLDVVEVVEEIVVGALTQ
jgi:hypothetical protein